MIPELSEDYGEGSVQKRENGDTTLLWIFMKTGSKDFFLSFFFKEVFLPLLLDQLNGRKAFCKLMGFHH